MIRAFVPATEKMLGQILVERNVISPAHLQLALDRQQRATGKCKYLGEILLEMGVPQAKIHEALEASGKRRRLGEILIDLGILTVAKLEQVLEKQRELARKGIRKPLGKILVELGYANPDSLLPALSKHFNMPTVSLKSFYPSPSLQKAVGDTYAQKHMIVVLENDSTRIRLALAEPNPWLMDELKRLFPPGKRVEFYLANPLEMGFCLRQKFDPFLLSNYR